MIKLKLSKTLPCLLSLATTIALAAPALAGKTFDLNAIKDDANTLKRTDIGSMKDPFGESTPTADTPMDPGVFKLDTVQTGSLPPPKAFPLNASDDGDGNLQPQNAMPAQEPVQQAQTDTPKRTFNPNDPDSSPEMQIAWDEWHRRVAGAIFAQYSRLANAAFYKSRPLAAVAAYTVTRNGRIINARLTQPNMNPIYNAICLTAIGSLDGNQLILQFPQGSRRMTVDKASTFIQNNEANQNRFKTIQGDHETIRQR